MRIFNFIQIYPENWWNMQVKELKGTVPGCVPDFKEASVYNKNVL